MLTLFILLLVLFVFWITRQIMMMHVFDSSRLHKLEWSLCQTSTLYLYLWVTPVTEQPQMIALLKPLLCCSPWKAGRTPHSWRNGRIKCKGCHGMIPKLSGITCGNLVIRSNGDKIWYSTCHPLCFDQSDKDMFTVL